MGDGGGRASRDRTSPVDERAPERAPEPTPGPQTLGSRSHGDDRPEDQSACHLRELPAAWRGTRPASQSASRSVEQSASRSDDRAEAAFGREPAARGRADHEAPEAAVDPGIDGAFLVELIEAALDVDLRARDAVVGRLMAHGVGAMAIATDYVPAAARRLGELWSDDELGFADVSMGTSRLQGLVRDLHGAPADPFEAGPPAPLIAVAVPEGETHTLGAVVAATQLRAAGASVLLLMGRSDAETVEAVRGGDLSLVCVSSSERGRPGTVAAFVGALRAASGVPVALGGAIVGGDLDADALGRLTGADLVTCDAGAALRLGAAPAPRARG